MTYLLKSEVDQHSLKTELELLKSKYEELHENITNRYNVNIYTQPSSLLQTNHDIHVPPPPPPLRNFPTQSKQQQALPAPIMPISQSTPAIPYYDNNYHPSQQQAVSSSNNHNNNHLYSSPITMAKPLVPSSMQIPSKILLPERQYSSKIRDDEDDDKNNYGRDGVVKSLDSQFQQVEQFSNVTPMSSIVATTLNNIPTESPAAFYRGEQRGPGFTGFTGSSPTDLLFSPHSLNKFNQGNTTSVQSTPLPPTYQQPQSSINRATPTTIPTQDLRNGRVNEEESEDDGEDDQVHDMMKFNNHKQTEKLSLLRDSTESTIERLSHQFTNVLTSHKPIHHNSSSNNNLHPHGIHPVTSLSASPVPMKDEQPSIVVPNSDVPRPLQPPKHPFAQNNTSNMMMNQSQLQQTLYVQVPTTSRSRKN